MPCSRLCVLAALALAAPCVALAQTGEPQPLWELGVGVLGVSQQAYPGASDRVQRGLIFPYLVYRGQFLRADRDGVGLRAIKTPDFELDIGFAGAFGSSSNDVEARRGMPNLGTLVEFGPRLKWNLGAAPGGGRLRADFPLRGVFDLSDHLRSKGLAFEPRLVYENRLGNWLYDTSVGAVVGNRRLADTLYGVAPVYATATRPAYEAESGLIAWRLGATLGRQLSPNWRVFGVVRLDSVAGAANRSSPLVQKTVGATYGLGFTYTWAKSEAMVTN